jgi:hypothetical protein
MPRCSQRSSPKLIEKTYPLAGLAGSDTDLLIQAITRAVKPKTWSDRGGCGTIEYCAERKALIVNQTAGAHKQVEAVLKALAALQSKQPARTSPITRAVYNSPSPHLKQYGHFVLDNVKINAMGVSCAIKRVRFMYKGDGIDADAAKSVLPACTVSEVVCPERTVTSVAVPAVPAVSCQPEQPACAGTPLVGAGSGALVGKAIGGGRTTGSLIGGALGEVSVDTPQAKQPKAEVKKSDETSKIEKGKAKPE